MPGPYKTARIREDAVEEFLNDHAKEGWRFLFMYASGYVDGLHGIRYRLYFIVLRGGGILG